MSQNPAFSFLASVAAYLTYGASGAFAPYHSGFGFGQFCKGVPAICKGIYRKFSENLIFTAVSGRKGADGVHS